jgi:hypothetical protein
MLGVPADAVNYHGASASFVTFSTLRRLMHNFSDHQIG